MPQIPIVGFLLEAVGAVAVALMLSSFERRRPRAGVRDWSLGLWCLASGLLASVAASRTSHLPSHLALLVLAFILTYWSPALVLVGTWTRWFDRPLPHVRRSLLAGLAVVGLVTTLAAQAAGTWGLLLRSGTCALLTMAGYLAGGVLLLHVAARRSVFGARVLALSFLGLAAEEGLFFSLVASGDRVSAMPSASQLIEVELLLLMLEGVGMVAWLLEEERESALNLQQALQRKEALMAIGGLVAGVAHEVRNPLFGISATLDALAARIGEDAAPVRYVAAMREQVGRLSQLMTELLDFGRPIASELTRQSVSTVATKAIAACHELAERARVAVESTAADSDDLVLMDEPRLLQVFQNLVQNAVEHTAPGGRVCVETRPELLRGRPGVRCAVRDSGPGFEPAQLPHVFEPFFSRRHGGTGLGLSIVQRIVEQHSGRVEAANHPEGGAVVSVWLPAAAAGV
jgi:signal transduction histidine kinase